MLMLLLEVLEVSLDEEVVPASLDEVLPPEHKRRPKESFTEELSMSVFFKCKMHADPSMSCEAEDMAVVSVVGVGVKRSTRDGAVAGW